MQTTIIGFPRIGSHRELKFTTEGYFKGNVTAKKLLETGKQLRHEHWQLEKDNHIELIPSNDFSFYDTMLDMSVLLNIIPKRYKDLHLNPLDEYFAMARGYQGAAGDVKALAMKKWFNTNYHYIVPEIEDDTEIKLAGSKLFDEFSEAAAMGIKTKPVIPGAFTFLHLADYTGSKKREDFVPAMVTAYQQILAKAAALGAEWIQIDEPMLVTDLTPEDITLFQKLYQEILAAKTTVKVLCQTYFGDIRNCYPLITKELPFDGIGIDFVEGRQSMALVQEYGFPADRILFAGLINGKNIWRNSYAATLKHIHQLQEQTSHLILNTSCSLLHVPFTIKNESALPDTYKIHFAFAIEKLQELADLGNLADSPAPENETAYKQNTRLFATQRHIPNQKLHQRIASLTEADLTRQPARAEREKIQHQVFHLPLLPTTTIGSFPQTAEVRKNRSAYKKHEITSEAYIAANKQFIEDCIQLQEHIGLDVLVHGEFERNDMVEYFGEHLDGYVFTENAWVQSYGTRCVKPPVIWGDITRRGPITVNWSMYAQSLTKKPVKGMLTGPVTILNWSFPREDIPLKESAFQIAFAIREEVLDLEKNGIHIIQIDEAALREKLPLRQADWHREYLDWAIPAFRLVHSGVKPQTQIHTHMCYSEFEDIIKDIDHMDADVITFEASRSNLTVVDAMQAAGFETETGPGIYDIHSPRIPTVTEIEHTLKRILSKFPAEKLWVNPDCGLKTRKTDEVIPSLKNLVQAARQIRGLI